MNNIRNFCIIAHIDHGKSTLADRFLELTKTVPKEKISEQYLDKMSLEKERGITIKMHPVQMHYIYDGVDYELNLIDTPGHVDFTYEVSRSLLAVEGAVLLVDATQGVQAQTISNLDLAKAQNLKIIPVINKIDLEVNNLEERQQELADLLHINKDEVILVSAKKGTNINVLIEQIIKLVPEPKGQETDVLKALIFDSKYDPYKGIIAYIRVFDGKIKSGDKIYFMAQGKTTEVLETGIFKPELVKTDILKAGDIGFVATGLKDPTLVRVGDTITHYNNHQLVKALSGYLEPRPMVFAGFYPESKDDYEVFRDALLKLKLNDASLSYEPENSDALGKGFRLGFLGMLHLEIIRERLIREYGLKAITTQPVVPYKIYLRDSKEPITIINPLDYPTSDQIIKTEEPYVQLEIISQSVYLSNIMKLLNLYRANQVSLKNISSEKLMLVYELPFSEILRDLYDKLKSVSLGYASMEYRLIGFREAQIEKLEVILANQAFDSLSRLVPRERAESEARSLALSLKHLLPKENYAIPIQIRGFGRIIARETISALKKDVTGHLYGGDRTRKIRLWKKQKKGKKKLSEKAKLRIDGDVFLKLLKNR